MERKIVDYKVVVREVATDFWGTPLEEQTAFEQDCLALINKGYVPYDESKLSSGSAGGLFSVSQYPTISQAFVKYELQTP